MSHSLPRHAGGFLLVRELGRGGMGVVYEAHESASGRTVALKVLAAELALSPETFERFKREARLAAAISDSRCVFVYGAHEIEGSPAISMELVGGETLQERIALGEEIPIATVVRWTLDLIDGLEAAHRSGILHRDVKPSNCFLTVDGRVKVGDFGLSRSLERDIQLTQAGQFLGSPLYASPEQVRGREVDERSDQYSCAATLYALLTGSPPFTGTNVGEVLARILSEAPVPPRSIRAAIPEELERVVLKALEREPARRFKDLGALRAALEPFGGATATRASIPRRLVARGIDFAVIAMLNSAITIPFLDDIFQSGGPAMDKPGLAVSTLIQLAAIAITIAYFGLLESLWGASLGKWLMGLRVTNLSGERPRARAILRSFAYEAPTVILTLLLLGETANNMTVWPAIGGILITALLCSTMRKRNGWRMLHEFASGTRTIQVNLPFRTQRGIPAPTAQEPAVRSDLPATLGRYRIEGLLLDSRSGRVLAARDAQLERSVWIQLHETGSAVDEARRALARPAKLRWLEALDAAPCTADVFEAPGGAALESRAQQGVRFEWSFAERALSQLGDELEACGFANTSVSQLWIDRDWNLRVLDEPLSGLDAKPRTPLELLGEAARLLVSRDGRSLPQDLPLRSEEVVRRLIGIDSQFETFAQARSALLELRTRPSTITGRQRAAQIAVGAVLPMVGALILIIGSGIQAKMMAQLTECKILILELQELHAAGLGPIAERPALDAQDVGRRQLALAWTLGQGLGPLLSDGLIRGRPEAQPVIEAARAAFPNPDETAVQAALLQLRAERGPPKGGDAAVEFTAAHPFMVIGLGAAAGWTFWGCIFAVCFPGGLTLRLFGFSVRARSGRRASRALGLLRTLLAGLPFVA